MAEAVLPTVSILSILSTLVWCNREGQHSVPMNMPSQTTFRLVTLVLAIVLGAQCVWLLLAELSRPGITRLPTGATITAKQRNDATWAAWIGAIRGDLWAESAYTYSDLLWASSGNNSERIEAVDEVKLRLDRALRYAPHQSSTWLLIAGMAARYRWSRPDPTEALKMSYYTGPSELPLMPVRLLVMAQLDETKDSELQLLARRDIRLLITHQGKPAVVHAFQSATPAGKQFIEQAVIEIDPTFVQSLRAGIR